MNICFSQFLPIFCLSAEFMMHTTKFCFLALPQSECNYYYECLKAKSLLIFLKLSTIDEVFQKCNEIQCFFHHLVPVR